MAISLAAAAAIAGVVSGVMAVGGAAWALGNSEADFEKLRDNMDTAARDNPRVVKFLGIYYFFHKDDFSSASVVNGKVHGQAKAGAKKHRIVCFRPNDGWLSNSWTIWTYVNKGDSPKKYEADNKECADMFRTDYLKGKIAMQKQQQDRLADAYV